VSDRRAQPLPLRVPRETADRKPRGSNPVAPTFFQIKPFGENVEGLFCFKAGVSQSSTNQRFAQAVF
jgi:hypothetical protein